MKKAIYFGLVLLMTALSLFVMNGYSYFSKPHDASDNVPAHFAALRNSVEQQQWDAAEQQYQFLDQAWYNLKPRIQFSVEKDEMISIDLSLARLGSCIQLRERTLAMIELSEIESHWQDLCR